MGQKAVGIKMPEPLTNEVLRDTIPMVQVPEAAELFRGDLTKHKQGQKGIGVSSGRTDHCLRKVLSFLEFTATDMNGRTWSNADIKGGMVLNVWFTGCGPCRAEMPELSAWKDEMPGVMFFSSTFESAKVARPRS